jgi:hypothetical protein
MQPRKAAAGGLVSKMKLKTIKKRIVIYLVNHVLAGTRFFPAKRSLLRSIGYEIGENKLSGRFIIQGRSALVRIVGLDAISLSMEMGQ